MKVFLSITLVFTLCSCAGPIPPFGAVHLVKKDQPTLELKESLHPARFMESKNTMVYIDTPYLLFHRPYEINIQFLKKDNLTPVLSLNNNDIDLTYLSNVTKYENQEIINYMQIKYQMMMGILSEENDWRLDKRMSLVAGSEFLNYIDSYWSKDKNKELLN
jgi:hypothetical protein